MTEDTSSTTPDRPEFGGLRLVAGHPALDFVNSVKFRGRSVPGDRLEDYAAAVAWSRVAGVIDDDAASAFRRLGEADLEAAAAAHREVVRLREALRSILPSREGGADARGMAEALLGELLTCLAQHRRIDRETMSLRIEPPVGHPRDLILWLGLAVQDLLTRDVSKRIGFCDGDDCDWVFLAGSRGRARRWCDSRTCGNAARVRQHRGKQRSRSEEP